MPAMDMKAVWVRLQDELETSLNTLRDKGAQQFTRPLVVALVFLLAAYKLSYAPSVKNLAKVKARGKAVKAVGQHAEQYAALRDRLNSLYDRLPRLRDRDQWLLNSVMDSMRADGIVSDAIQPASESEAADIVYQELSVGFALKFEQAYAWVQRLETARPWLHVSTLEVAKQPQSPGIVQVKCGIGTMIVKTRATQ